MAGTKLADALDAARAFLAHEGRRPTRSPWSAFGSQAVQLTPFSQSTADADDALRLLTVDSKTRHGALRRAAALAASSLRTQLGRARVVVLLTDGKDVSSQTSLTGRAGDRARHAARSSTRSRSAATARPPQPLQQIATETGGSFKSAATSASLNAVYASIASELKRTWRVEYVTAARPGEKLHLAASRSTRRAPASTDVARSPAARPRTPAAARCRARSTRRSAGCC